MSEWQPIETAPDDGSLVDLWIGNERVPNCFYRGEIYGWQFISPTEGGEHGFPLDAFFREEEITHWRPLPEPPKASENAG